MSYSVKVVDHYENPRNVGTLDKSSTEVGTGLVGGPVIALDIIDGRLVGTTPTKLSDFSVGDHVIRLELDGYRRWSSSVRIISNEQTRVTASLEK